MKKNFIKKKKSDIQGKMNNFKVTKFILITIQFICLGIFLCQIFYYYQYKEENTRLNSLMEEYKTIQEDIKIYEELKNNYTIQLEETENLTTNHNGLQEKINTLNQEITSLQTQIEDITKKIKAIS